MEDAKNFKHTITADEYQRKALRTYSAGFVPLQLNEKDLQLMEGLMGLNGESGEALDILKKCLFQGHTFDRDHMIRELGDIAWYLAIAADALSVPLSEVFEKNIEKLEKRYPEGFDAERSVNREDDDI